MQNIHLIATHRKPKALLMKKSEPLLTRSCDYMTILNL